MARLRSVAALHDRQRLRRRPDGPVAAARVIGMAVGDERTRLGTARIDPGVGGFHINAFGKRLDPGTETGHRELYGRGARVRQVERSEEHTSELQSLMRI